MSDERDQSSRSRWEQLLRQLEQSHRRLEEAHAEYLEATAESQRALADVVDAFGDITRTVRELVPEPDTDASVLVPEPPTDDEVTDQPEATSKPTLPEAAASTPEGADQPENALPARLHSRGVPIPDEREPSAPAEPRPDNQSTRPSNDLPKKSPPAAPMTAPLLVDADLDDARKPYPGLDKERRIVLTNDGFGVAAALNDLLSQRGYRVRVESRRPELSAPADTIIFLGSLRAPSDLDDAMSVVDDAVVTADRMTTRLMQPDSGFVAAIDTGGGFGIDSFEPVTAPYGSLLGLMRLLDRRHPGAATKLIDIDGGRLSGEQIAEKIADELLEGGATSPVALGQNRRRSVDWADFQPGAHPASWLQQETPPLVYMPGTDAVLATAVERLAIAHELPVAVLRRRHTSSHIAERFDEMGIEVRTTDYDLNHLFSVMDFLDSVRSHYGPIQAIIAESTPAQNPDELARWEVMRPPLDEFNALLAMTINDPLSMLGVGLGPKTPPVVSSALRYFARAESLRRNDRMAVRLAHLARRPRNGGDDFNPQDFALTEFLASDEPEIAEIQLDDSTTQR